jgi:mono/diheme cytochrome c family protein
MPRRSPLFLTLGPTSALALALTVAASAESGPAAPAAAPEQPSYAREVAPVLDRWCVPCHGSRQQQGGLRLDGYAWLMRGGDAGPVVVAGSPAESLLVAKIERRHRPPMPPRRRLARALVVGLRAWIAAGAPP